MSYKPLIWGLGIIIFGGLFLMAFMSPFQDTTEIEDNWVEDYGVVGLTGLMFDFIKYPVSVVTVVIDFLGGNWQIFSSPTDALGISINNTGTHDGDTLDGLYTLERINEPASSGNITIFTFKKDEDGLANEDKIVITTEEDELNEEYVFKEAELYYATSFVSYAVIYNATGNNSDLLTEWTNVNDDYDFNPTADGEYLLEDGYDFSSVTSQFWNFMDTGKETTQDAVKGFGFIPEIIGVPIFMLILIGIIYAVIKLLPLT